MYVFTVFMSLHQGPGEFSNTATQARNHWQVNAVQITNTESMKACYVLYRIYPYSVFSGFFFSESVCQLLDENQRYLSQLTSLLQDATQEMKQSVMV